MATYEKISEMDAASALDGTETLEVVQSGDSVKATGAQVAAFVAGDATSQATIEAAVFPAGLILPFGNTTAPTGFLACNDAAVSREDYAALFAAIGTTWGVGDGSTTFNVPDLRGAFLRGTGSHGSATMADSNPFAGPSVGSTENDQMQGHKHGPPTLDYLISFTEGGGGLGLPSDGNQFGTPAQTSGPEDDGTNGTPRSGDETRPFAAGVLYCIKT